MNAIQISLKKKFICMTYMTDVTNIRVKTENGILKTTKRHVRFIMNSKHSNGVKLE